jgi:hypothetical protein
MNRFPRPWLVWLADPLGPLGPLVLLGAPAPASAHGGGCAAALTVSGPPRLESALVAELGAGDLGGRPVERCRGVRVDLRRSGDELDVTLRAPNGTISRRVASVADAAFWIESWLEPELDEDPAARPDGPAGSAAARALPTADTALPQVSPVSSPSLSSPAASAPPRFTVGLIGRTSVDGDGVNWNGMELFGDVDVAPPFWLGAGLGRSWDYAFGASALGNSIERVTTHAIVRAGGAWLVTHRTQWSIGFGVGVMSAFVRGSPVSRAGVVSDDEGVGVLELTSSLRFMPTRSLGLRLGLELARSVELERDDAREPDEPLARVEPSWRGGLFLGVGLALGQE